MIVELFGPPAVGKTTVSHLLAQDLRERGFHVDLALSFRPAEVARTGNGASSNSARLAFVRVARRVARPAMETLATARYLVGDSPEATMARKLLAVMPPVSPLWRLRLRQYIWRLTHTWNKAHGSDRIVIFDQAFVQAICSLGLLCAPRHAGRLPVAFGMVPRADFLVRLDAPVDTLRQRLIERERQQGRLERLLELDLHTNLRSIAITDHLAQLVGERHAASACIQSDDTASRLAALEHVQRIAAARFAMTPASA